MDPRKLKFKKTAEAGRKLTKIIDISSKYPRELWSGSPAKAEDRRSDIMWEVLCAQAEAIESLTAEVNELKNKLDSNNLVHLEPID